MDAPPGLESQHLDVRLNDRSLVSSTAGHSTAAAVSMLSNANKAVIKNSSFTIDNSTTNYNTNNGSSTAPSLKLLYKTAAPNAILNAGGRADEVRCHPGTREEVIGLVEKFIAQAYDGPRMLWLSGPAGAGKSAIMQTVAERCKTRGDPQANFFFFRGDGSRSNAGPLVATLMHQIIKLYPSIRPAVAATLASDPLIFQTGLDTQFDALLHQTLPTVQDAPSASLPLTLLIDGLDECDSENKTAQRQLLQALDTLLVEKGLYFRIVVASRVESQISMAFKQLRSQVDSIFLDEEYSPEKDIRLFVTAEFEKIKSAHSLAHTLDKNWPSKSDIDGIVSKSSGQFIFAATVMRFIAQSSASPELSLQKVQGIVPPVRNTPFAYIDAIYTHILEHVDDWEAVKCIFAFRLGEVGLSAVGISRAMHTYQPRYSAAVFASCKSELNSIIRERDGDLQFFHASFPDFLQDKSRARQYHIDLGVFFAAAFPIIWAPNTPLKSAYSVAINSLKHIQQLTPEIVTALMTVHPRQITQSDTSDDSYGTRDLGEHLHRLYNRQSLSDIMHKWISADPTLAPYFSKYLSRRKRTLNFVKKGLRHMSVNSKSGK